MGGIPYHSPYDPIRESSRFFNNLNIEEADIILQFGWGLGYGSDALRTRTKPTARIIVFEPTEGLLDLARAQLKDDFIWRDPRFQFVSGAEVCQFFSHETPVDCQETDRILWVEWPGAVQLHSPILAELKRELQAQLRDRAANLLTHFQNGRMYFENVIRNHRYLGDADVGRLFGKFNGVPLVIISAGPSLDRNIRELRGIEDRCFLLAVDTALRPLLHAGVIPHAVIMADPTELNARHIVGAMPERTFLIAEQGVHHTALESASRRFLYSLGLFPDSLFAKFGFQRAQLDVWGSVATAALDLACRVGASPVIFTGQDLSYSWNRKYARHTIFDDSTWDSGEWPGSVAKDIWGRDTPTTENLIAYRDFFVRRIKNARHTRFINATEGGILRDGVEILSLKDALYQSCNRLAHVENVLETCYRPQRFTRAPLEHLEKALCNPNRVCDCRDGFLELVAKEAMLKEDSSGMQEAIDWGRRVLDKKIPS